MARPTYPLTPTEAADYLGVHVETVKRWAREGKVKAARTPGGWWKFNEADLDAVLVPNQDDAA